MWIDIVCLKIKLWAEVETSLGVIFCYFLICLLCKLSAKMYYAANAMENAEVA